MPLPDNIIQVRIGNDHFTDITGAPLTGDVLRVFPTEQRFVDGVAKSVIYGAVVQATVDAGGAAWVTVPATDNAALDTTFSYGINEPDGQTGYYVLAPSTAPVDGTTGLPTLDLSLAVHAPAPITGLVQLATGEDGLSVLTGSTVPSNGLGVDGQAYIDTTHGKLYVKAAGAWNSGLDLTGGGGGVTSVNTHTGVVTLAASDVGAVATSTLGAHGGTATLDAGGNVPLSQLGNVSGGGAVASVNGHTGTVVLAASDVGAVATGDSRLTDQRAPLTAFVTSRPVNVRYTGNSLADAIMDGATHPLSGRFTTLSDAQAVFPGAVALTDEIDYWAIQTLLNTAPKVYLSWGTAVVHKALLLKAGGNQELAGEGPNITSFFLRSGSNSNVISPADTTNLNPNVTLRRFSVNGNKAGNTGAIGQTDNILLVRAANLRVEDVESFNANGRGIHHHGLTGSVCNVQKWRDIYVHDNMHWGLHNSNGVRQVAYTDIKCISNGLRTDISLASTGSGADQTTGGFLLDHSEVTASGIHVLENGQEGLWVRNVFASDLTGIVANRNGRSGIRVLGMVGSGGSDWVSQSNGVNTGLVGHDVWFDGTATLDYGVTADTKITNITAGPNLAAADASQGSWSGNEDYAVWFDDNMAASDMTADFKLLPGTAGTIRYPSAGIGSMHVNDGTGLSRVNIVTAAGSAQTLPDVNVAENHRLVLTASSCAITLPPLPPVGFAKGIYVKLIQDASGSRLATFLPGGSVIKWAGGGTPPTLTTVAGGADAVTFVSDDGGHWVGTVVDQNI